MKLFRFLEHFRVFSFYLPKLNSGDFNVNLSHPRAFCMALGYCSFTFTP